jgi:hypothetical protein
MKKLMKTVVWSIGILGAAALVVDIVEYFQKRQQKLIDEIENPGEEK